MLSWVNQFNICTFLDNHQYASGESMVECIAGAGVLNSVTGTTGSALSELHQFHISHNDWKFGHLSYDLKNETERLRSEHPDYIGFPDLFFFVPEVFLSLTNDRLLIGVMGTEHEAIFSEIINITYQNPVDQLDIKISQRFSKDEYLSTVESVRERIHAGDCYELNFCQEFYIETIIIDPVQVYIQLSDTSPNPFSAFYKMDGKFVICASPERYLKKKGDTLLSQPIKGTLARKNDGSGGDAEEREILLTSSKDRSENVMVVDLVRNDLSKVCEQGSVEVSELFGIYTFPHVHQMISSVTGKVLPDVTIEDIIRATFPMGSMTGAPKKRVMELIEKFEKSKRGIFSGSIGYLSPEGDFDFNVVIRSIMYNQQSGYLSYQVGSAITFYSDPQQEYNECLLKAGAIVSVLKNNKTNT